MTPAAVRPRRRIALGLACGFSALAASGAGNAQSLGRGGIAPGLSQSLSGYGSPGSRDPLAPDPLARGAGFAPYVEAAARETVGQRGDTRLVADLSAGLDAFINRDRAEGTLQFRLTDRLPVYGRSSRNQLLVDGLGRGQLDLVRNRLFLDVSTFADVVARDYSQGISIDQRNLNRNLTQIYYASAGPRLQREIGTVARLDARYNAAYTGVDNRLSGGGGFSGGNGGTTGAGSGLSLQPLSNSFSQTGEVSVANQPRDGRLIVKLTGRVSGQEQQRLRQTFRSYIGDVDLTYAISRPVALVGKVGYEDYRSRQQHIRTQNEYLITPFSVTENLLNAYFIPGTTVGLSLPQFVRRLGPPATILIVPGTNRFLGNPVLSTANPNDPATVYDSRGPIFVGATQTIDPHTGDYVADASLPRYVTYAQKGLVWNAGFRYTPSRRSLLELRVGQRFADVTVTGVVRQQFRNGIIITGALTDGIETFSTILTRLVNGVPVSFVSNSRGNSLGGGLQSVSSGVFRSRIGTIAATLDRGKTSYGLEYTYNNRRYLDAGAAIEVVAIPIDPTLVKREDVTQSVNARLTHHLDNRQTLDGDVFFGFYDLGLTRRSNDRYAGARVRYDYRFKPGFDVFADASLTQRFAGRSNRGAALATVPLPGNSNGYLLTTFSLGARYRF